MSEDLREAIEDWHEDGLCYDIAEAKPELRSAWIKEPRDFTSVKDIENYNIARSVCDDCPMQRLCFTEALHQVNDEGERSAQGIRGGYEFDEGRLLKADLIEARRKFGLTIRITPSNVRDSWVKKEEDA